MEKIKGKKLLYSIISISIVIVSILIWDGCNSRKGLRDFENQISNFKLKEQGFEKTIDKQGKEIVEQNQILVTRDQAIQQGLLANTKLKKIISQVSITTNIRVDTLFIPFTEEDNWGDWEIWEDFDDVKTPLDNIIMVPKAFSKSNEWYGMAGRIVKKGIEIDSIKFLIRMTVTIGDKKVKGLRNIFKRRIPSVEVINESPYASIGGLQNVVIKKKPKKWYQTTLFKMGVGFALGTYTTIKIRN